MFSKELIQAISDWQRGGDAKQKTRRGKALKAEAAKLPEQYKQPPELCYRQISLRGSALMHMGSHFRLSESVSSWTKCEAVARDFKGGVPPPGDYQGVIFALSPTPQSIVVNLTALFANPEFVAALEQHQNEITGFGDGIGRYGNLQQEVVIEISELALNALRSWGGYSSAEQRLADMYFGQKPTDAQMSEFRGLMAQAGHKVGAYWLSTPAAVARVTEKLKMHAERLAKLHGSKP